MQRWDARKCAAAHHVNFGQAARKAEIEKRKPDTWKDAPIDGTAAQFASAVRSYPWLGKA